MGSAQGVAPAPWVLEVNVTELYGDLEEAAGNPAAVMRMQLTILDEGSARPKVIYQRALSWRAPIASASPEALVRGYGTALSNILAQFGTDLSSVSPQ